MGDGAGGDFARMAVLETISPSSATGGIIFDGKAVAPAQFRGAELRFPACLWPK